MTALDSPLLPSMISSSSWVRSSSSIVLGLRVPLVASRQNPHTWIWEEKRCVTFDHTSDWRRKISQRNDSVVCLPCLLMTRALISVPVTDLLTWKTDPNRLEPTRNDPKWPDMEFWQFSPNFLQFFCYFWPNLAYFDKIWVPKLEFTRGSDSWSNQFRLS